MEREKLVLINSHDKVSIATSDVDAGTLGIKNAANRDLLVVSSRWTSKKVER